jgi:adenine-specific DNA-methyltransferase
MRTNLSGSSQNLDALHIGSERALAGLAVALLTEVSKLTPEEKLLTKELERPPAQLLAAARGLIAAGTDPLGEAFCALRSSDSRRVMGATYTPPEIVASMVHWAKNENRHPKRIVDAGAGSGRFTMAAAKAFPHAELVAVETDPLAALLLRANAVVHGFAKRLRVEVIDFRNLELPHIAGPTLFIGNPPYVRHHQIGKDWKDWFAKTAKGLGFAASNLAGIHIHFFLKTRAIANSGDFGAYITASEWMDVNYGALLRKMLADGLGGTSLHVIDPSAMPFADTMSTGAITCFRIGQRPAEFLMRSVGQLDQLKSLDEGRSVNWGELGNSGKWSILIRNSHVPKGDNIELGELFRVHRGQVTGKNSVWIAGAEAAGLPERYLFPCITRAQEIIKAGDTLHEKGHLKRLIDLPNDLDELEDEELSAVKRFLDWAKKNEGDKGWVATHRRRWWSVGLRAPAPILCTYMARRAPAFVRNKARAHHLNIAHGLYPVEPLSESVLLEVLAYLRRNVGTSGGRTYAGGLVKYEPREIERLHIPALSVIAERNANAHF